MTVLARRSRRGDRILCGHPGPDGPCRGEIAAVEYGDDGESIPVPMGMVEDPRGSGMWRLTARSRRKQAEGRKPARPRESLLDATLADPLGVTDGVGGETVRVKSDPMRNTRLPWRRECPRCKRVNGVTVALLR